MQALPIPTLSKHIFYFTFHEQVVTTYETDTIEEKTDGSTVRVTRVLTVVSWRKIFLEMISEKV